MEGNGSVVMRRSASATSTAASALARSSWDHQLQVCAICFTNPEDMAFCCGHQICFDCGQTLQSCPLCSQQCPSVPPQYPEHDASSSTIASILISASWDHQVCTICLTNPQDIAFACGHQICFDCGQTLPSCPLCSQQCPSAPPQFPEHVGSSGIAASAPTSASLEHQVCPICLTNPKDMAFGCGHRTCCDCGQTLQACPLCRSPIQIRIKLY